MRLRSIVLGLAVVTSGVAASTDPRLAQAAKKMDKTAVRALLDQHLDVNAAETDGTTALHWAVYKDDVETAALLIQAGADVKKLNGTALLRCL